MEELLPVVAMSLEILQRNLKTQELLEWTQEQAEELTAQQESILEAEERTRLILESTDEGIFGVDMEGDHLREPRRVPDAGVRLATR